jgi:hypothetical protein
MTPPEPSSSTPARSRAVRVMEGVATGCVAALMAGLGVAGAVVSYATVVEVMRPSFGALAPLVPLGVDAGILAVTGMDLLQARHHHRSRWIRFVPWALVGLTSWLNASAATSTLSAVTHAALPGLWVLAVEGAGHSIRHYAGLAAPARENMDGIRLSRWLYAPIQTALLARRRSLWEITDYSEALQRDRNRRLARCDLQERYGSLAWRWKRDARRDRVAYRLGALAPKVKDAPAVPNHIEPVVMPARSRPPSRTRASNRQPARDRNATGVDELLPLAKVAARELAEAGEPLVRRTLKAKLAEQGHPVGSNPKLDSLLTLLRADQHGAEPPEASVPFSATVNPSVPAGDGRVPPEAATVQAGVGDDVNDQREPPPPDVGTNAEPDLAAVPVASGRRRRLESYARSAATPSTPKAAGSAPHAQMQLPGLPHSR